METGTGLQRWRKNHHPDAASLAQTEAPTLLVVRKDGGWWTDEELVW